MPGFFQTHGTKVPVGYREQHGCWNCRHCVHWGYDGTEYYCTKMAGPPPVVDDTVLIPDNINEEAIDRYFAESGRDALYTWELETRVNEWGTCAKWQRVTPNTE